MNWAFKLTHYNGIRAETQLEVWNKVLCGAKYYTARRALKEVKDLSEEECNNSYPTLGESGKLVYIIGGSITTSKHQLIHVLLGGPMVG